MAKNHFSLNPGFSVGLIAATGAVAAILLFVSRPRPVSVVVLALVSGIVAGALQRRSIQAAPELFARAQTAVEVRRAFMSNGSGKVAIGLTWVFAAVLVVLGLRQRDNALVIGVLGFATFMFAREVVSFGATRDLRASGSNSQHAF